MWITHWSTSKTGIRNPPNILDEWNGYPEIFSFSQAGCPWLFMHRTALSDTVNNAILFSQKAVTSEFVGVHWHSSQFCLSWKFNNEFMPTYNLRWWVSLTSWVVYIKRGCNLLKGNCFYVDSASIPLGIHFPLIIGSKHFKINLNSIIYILGLLYTGKQTDRPQCTVFAVIISF